MFILIISLLLLRYTIADINSQTPRLIHFTIDCGIGKLSLTFNELVNAKTMNVKGISFQSANNLLLTNSRRQSLNMSLLSSISLTSAYNNIQSQGNTTELTIFLNSNDFAKLQLAYPLFDTLSTTYITLDTNSIYSTIGIPNIEINSTNGLMVDTIIKDSFPPYLINFQLNMDTGKIFLLFSEPINITTFHLFGLAIQGQSYIGDKRQGFDIVELNGPYVNLVDNFNSFLVETSNYNRLIVYQLGVDNLNAIKAITNLATSLETSFISAYEPFVNDLSGNPVSLIDIDRFYALKASKYTADITSPILLYWDFNRLTARVQLTFSETIDIHLFNYSKIIFVSDPSSLASVFNPITELRVENPIITTHNNTDKVTFTLNKEQFIYIESSTHLLQSKYHGSYIVLEYLLTLDTSSLQNKYLGNDSTYHNPRSIRKFYDDNNAPVLKYFTLNMKTRILTLTFTEPIKLASIKLQYLTLQSSKFIDLTTEVFVLSNSICRIISTEETGVVDVLFTSSTAFSILSGFQYLAKSAGTTFISLTRDFATDTRGNVTNKIERIKANYAMRASTFIPDDLAPSLDRWTIDLDLAQIQLNFSRPIDVTTIEVQLLALSSDSIIIPSTELLFLSNSSYALPAPILALKQTSVTQYTMVWVDVVTIQISYEDLKRIKLLYKLCRSIESCYLTYSSEFALDMASIAANNTFYQLSVLPVTFEAPYLYIPDTTPPHILNSTIDMNLKLLRFSMNEPINSATWNATVVHLMRDHVPLLQKYDIVLSEYTVEQDERMSMELVVELTMHDYIRIQQAKPLATIEGSVNITLHTGAIQDAYGNSLLMQHIIPSKFIDDTTSPQLLAVYLDYTLNSRNLSLYFDEMIHLSTIQKSFIFLVASSGATVSLSNAIIYDSQEDSSCMVKFDISSLLSELNILNLANQQSNTLVYISKEGSIIDDSINRNPIKAMPITASISDGLSLKSFRLDMMKKYLYLELNFPYLIQSIDLAKLTLIPAGQEKLRNSLSYTLIGIVKYYYDVHGPFVVIELTNADYIAIRSIFTIYSKNDIELSVNYDAVIDINGKHLASSNILECSLFIYDSTELFITSYELDLNEGILLIHFNKEAETSTLDLINALALQSSIRLNASSINFPLNNLTIIDQPDKLGYVSPNITTLLLSLNHGYPLTLREQILASAPLATALDSTYLTAKRGMIYDLARPRNPVNAITFKQAKQVSQLQLDNNGPILVSFNIDFSQRILTLFYNEAVNSNTVHVDRIFLLKDRFDPLSITYQLTLTSEVIISSQFLHEIQVQLSTSDINNIMNLSPKGLFISSESSYIFTLDGIVEDIASPPNDAPEVLLRYGVPVDTFISDTVPPEALWYNISVETGNMIIFFNELIPCSSITPSLFIFQYEAYTGTTVYHYQLSTKASVDCTGAVFNNYAYITMDLQDILQLKAFGPNFAKTKEHLYVRFLSGAFQDVSGNLNKEILDGDALAPTEFDGDFNRPELLSWLINQEQQLSMFFIEPMEMRTLNILEFWVQNERVNPTMSYQLMLTSLFRVDPLQMRYDFDLLDDYNRIALNGVSVIFNIQELTFLRYSWKAMNDTSQNAILTVDRNDSIPLGPTVNQWNLDMNTGLLELVFSERVNPNFTCIGIEIQNEYTRSNLSIIYALTTNQKFQHSHPASISTYPYSSMIYIILNKHDMDALKLMLTTKLDSLYMTMKYDITKSLNAGDIIPYFATVEVFTHRARKISRYIRDITPPVCLSFSLDLGNGYFTLHFSEPVLVDSLKLGGMVLFSNKTGEFVTLSNAYISAELYDYVNIRVRLSIQDLIAIKLAIKPKTASTIHILDSLVMKDNSIKDFLHNKFIGNTPQTPILIEKNYILDNIPPLLLSWDMDLRALVLKLTFNEAIDLTSLHPSNVYLLSDKNYSTSDHRMQLSSYSIIADSLNNNSISNVITIDLGIYRYDSYRIQDIFTWGQYLNETYLAIVSVSDIFGNNNTVIQVSQVNHIQLNTRLLNLEAFDVDIDNANSKVLITFYLSNIVNIQSFSCSDFYFSESPSSSSNKIILTNNDCITSTLNNDYIVDFNFPISLLSTASNFGSSISNTWVYIPNALGITADINDNCIIKINPSYALNVGPQVLGVSLNLHDGILIYVFSKELDLSISIDISALGFYNSYTKNTYYLQSKVMNLNQPSIFQNTGNNMCQYGELRLDTIDLLNIKLLNADSSNLYALINFDPLSNQVLIDNNGIRLVNRDEVIHPLLVSNLIQDTEPPYIVDTTLDLSNNTFMIEFSTPMRLNSIILTQLCFQTAMDIKHSEEYYYCLTGGDMIRDLSKVIIYLTNADTSTLKIILNNLYGSDIIAYRLYLSYIYNTAQDLIGNLLPARSSHDALLIHSILEDSVQPRIISMKFNLNFFDTAELTLYFSEPIDSYMLQSNITNIIVQSRFASRDGPIYQLTGGTITSAILSTIVIQLTSYDINQMKSLFVIIRNIHATYLVIPPYLTTDLVGNPLIPFLDGNALVCNEYIHDQIPPSIITSTFNLDQGIITLVLTEPILLQSVNTSSFTIQYHSIDGLQISMKRYKLTSNSYISNSNSLSNIVVINLCINDQNELKARYPLVSSKDTTWFSFYSSFLEDVYLNHISLITTLNPIQVYNYIPDQTKPIVLLYLLDMNYDYILLTFSESISIVDLSQINIQNVETRRFGNYIYLNGTAINHLNSIDIINTYSIGLLKDSNSLKINLDNDILAYMKYYHIGKDIYSSYLVWSNSFVSDHSKNYLAPFWDASVYGYNPREPNIVHSDITPPKLNKWFLDRAISPTNIIYTNITAYLYFNEPVYIKDLTQIKMHYCQINKKNKCIKEISESYSLIPFNHTIDIAYQSYQREVIIPLINYCSLEKIFQLSTTALQIPINKNYMNELCKQNYIDLFTFLNQKLIDSNNQRYGYFITSNTLAVEDFSKNYLETINSNQAIVEKLPDCSNCPIGQYQVKECSRTTDRQCKVCSTCTSGTFIYTNCSAKLDTSCKLCDNCGYGSYIVNQCSIFHNTQCARCSICNSMEIETNKCMLGNNTVCNSCKICDFHDDDNNNNNNNLNIKKQCLLDKSYSSWFQSNCCKDNNGRTILCKDKDYATMLESSINGRHHWSTDPTSPKINMNLLTNKKYKFPNYY